jgi:flavin-dependent dehydrogenase
VKSRVGIVGCSINGSYLAWKLSKENEVIVFERNKVIGEKPCSGLISERIWNFIPKNEKIIENFIDRAIIHFPKKKIKLKFHPRMLVINRKSLDQYVFNLAKESGANILLNNEVKKVYFFKNKKPQILADKVYEFDYLIGCDGFNSIVRKSIGVKDPKYKLGIYTYRNKKDKSDSVDVYPSENGFAWIIPRGSTVEYGLLEDVDKAKDKFNKFCKGKGVKPGKIYSHIIPEGLVKAEAGRVALCGDAIGLTKPTSNGGIVWGLTACNFLLKDFPNFKKYNDDIKRFFEPKIFYSKATLSAGKLLGNKLSFLAPKEMWFDGDLMF